MFCRPNKTQYVLQTSWVALMLIHSLLIYLLKRPSIFVPICHITNVDVIPKSEFENLLSLATQESFFMFNDILYKQKDGVAMRSLLGSTVANAFLSFYKMNWLEQCPNESKPVFYRRYIDDIFVLFKSAEHLSKFYAYLNTFHPNMSFSFEQEINGKFSYLDVEMSRQ